MKCHICGGELHPIVTNLPFKMSRCTIVIIKELPVLQCENCSEFEIEDHVMERVEAILEKTDETVELEIVKFAA